MTIVDIITAKRDGNSLTNEEIQYFINNFTSGQIPDYQVSALLMAIFFKGMNIEETAFLTDAMIKSGKTINLSELDKPKIDKHSTGGVGDNLSLMIAPICSSLGMFVPMMSGRGLGHTGGTLDKLESIPGYKTRLNEKEIVGIIKQCGFVMMGQTDEIVPADRKLYALRDVTGTVESIPLITASILSKKFAEGSDGLLMDVKCGNGAFMKNESDAINLALSLKNIGKKLNKTVKTIITGMDQPLGDAIGNFIEVKDAYDFLNGKQDSDKLEIVTMITASMGMIGGVFNDLQNGIKRSVEAINSGKPLELFLKNIELQGGNPDFVINNKIETSCLNRIEIKSERTGYIANINALDIGKASVITGAGRTLVTDSVDPMSGIRLIKQAGDKVEAGETLSVAYYKNNCNENLIRSSILNAYTFSDHKPDIKKRIIREV